MADRGVRAYDVVVVGAGLSGLTAGALLARGGKKVLVVEAESKPGGYARSIDDNGYRFQQAVHLVMGGNEDGPFGPGLIHEVLTLLGVAHRCELVPVDPFYTVRFPELKLDVPAGREGYLAAHLEHFPEEEQGLTQLLNRFALVFGDFIRWPTRPRPVDWLAAPVRFPRLGRYLRASAADVVHRYLKDARLRALHLALAPSYLGLPPSQSSLLSWAVMMSSYIDEGAFYCRGGFQLLADALAGALVDHGGELLLNHRVERVQFDGDRVRGAALDSGREITSARVVSTIDARQTFGSLIDTHRLPNRWIKKIRDPNLSISAFGLYLGTDLDLEPGLAMENLILSGWDLEAEARAGLRGEGSDVTVTIPTLVDPSLAPPGHHQVVIQGAAPETQVDLDGLASRYVELAEQVIPGLSGHITHALGAEQAGSRSLPLHRLGPIYGWDNTPANSGPRRLPHITPIQGLYLAGQWTQPGHGVWTVMGSGVQAARLILDRQTGSGLLPLNL